MLTLIINSKLYDVTDVVDTYNIVDLNTAQTIIDEIKFQMSLEHIKIKTINKKNDILHCIKLLNEFKFFLAFYGTDKELWSSAGKYWYKHFIKELNCG